MPLLLTLVLLAASACAQAPVKDYIPNVNKDIPEDEGARKAHLLLNQLIAKLGGDGYLSYRDLSQEGRSYSFYADRPTDTGIRFWAFWKWPEKERIEFTKQRDVIYTYNGDQAWETTFRGTRPAEQPDLENWLRNKDYSLPTVMRRWLSDPATALFYQGTGVAEHKPVHKVGIVNGKNQSVTLAIDSTTGLLVQKSYQLRDPKTREVDEYVEVHDGYRMVQGINTPHSYTLFHNGRRTRQRFVEKVTYNTGLLDSLFTPTVTYNPDAKKR